MKKKKKIMGGQIVLHVILILLSMTVIYPAMNVVAVSFSKTGPLLRGEVTAWPVGFNLDAYRYMVRYRLINSGFRNSLYILFFGTSVNLIMTTLTAYGLSRKTLIGRRPIMFLITFTMMFGGGLIPDYILMCNLKLIDNLWALILPGAISAYNMIIMKNFFEALPGELSEAASIDGLSELGILIRIIIPLSLASICTIGMFYAVGHWNAYFSASFYINTRSKWPLQVVLRQLILKASTSGIEGGDDISLTTPLEQLKMSVVIATTLPILCVYPFLQKYFVKGVMIGSLKG